MWFECSECGGYVHGPSAPEVCPECGVASAIFVLGDPFPSDSDGDDLRASWLRIGLEEPELIARA